MEEYFEIGQIVNTSGLKGVLKIKPFTDDITKFNNLKTVYILVKNELQEFNIEQVRFNKNLVLLKLKEINNIEEAEKYRNSLVKIKRNKDEHMKENSYYIVDIIGCKVYTDEDKKLGEIIEVIQTRSNDVYIVKDELGKQILLPAIKDVIKNIDIENKKIIVHLLEGLI